MMVGNSPVGWMSRRPIVTVRSPVGSRDNGATTCEKYSHENTRIGLLVTPPNGEVALIDLQALRPYHSMPPHAGGEGMVGN